MLDFRKLCLNLVLLVKLPVTVFHQKVGTKTSFCVFFCVVFFARIIYVKQFFFYFLFFNPGLLEICVHG